MMENKKISISLAIEESDKGLHSRDCFLKWNPEQEEYETIRLTEQESRAFMDILRLRNSEQLDTDELQHYLAEIDDDLLNQAIETVIQRQKCSSSFLQRTFRLGFKKSSALMYRLHELGIIGDDEGRPSRKVLYTLEQWEATRGIGEKKKVIEIE